MAKSTPPSQEQVKALHIQLTDIFNKVGLMISYHNKRMIFFKKWNFVLRFIDSFVVVGGLVIIGVFPEKDLSFPVAGAAVMLLILNIIFDFSKKEETHRWLISSYTSINKLVANINIEDWGNFSSENYKKYKKMLFDATETMNNLKKEEYPMLDFLLCLSDILKAHRDGNSVSIIFRVKWWQILLADYFSMPNAMMKLLEKFRKEEEKKQQQQQQQQQETNESKTP